MLNFQKTVLQTWKGKPANGKKILAEHICNMELVFRVMQTLMTLK